MLESAPPPLVTDGAPPATGERLAPEQLRSLVAEDLTLLLRWRHADAQSHPPVDSALVEREDARVRSTYADLLASGAHVYRCMASVSFLHARLPRLPSYNELRAQVAASAGTITVADVGCAFGQDTRELLLMGVLPHNCLAIDVTSAYWDFGRSVFGDAGDGTAAHSISQCQTSFADWALPAAADEEDDVVHPYRHSRDVVVCLFVLHVLSREQTTHMLGRLAQLAKPGGLLIGACVGCSAGLTGGPWGVIPGGQSTTPRWLHSPASLDTELQRCGWTQEIDVRQYDRDTVGSLSGHPTGATSSLDPGMGKQSYLAFTARTSSQG